MITATVDAGRPVLLLAPVRGLLSEARAIGPALDAFGPEAIGVGVSPEELRGLMEYFVLSEAEPIVPLSPTELNEVRGLCRFGEVRVPNPSFLEALGWGRARSAAVAPLDPGEDASASMFTENIGYLELVRRTVRENRIGRSPPAPSSADAFALEWDRAVGSGRGSRRFAAARDAHFAEETRRLAAGRHQVAVLVDRERFEAVRGLLDRPVPARVGR